MKACPLSETKPPNTPIWQLVILPAEPVYCRPTPQEAWPCFRKPVSSITSTASGAPSVSITWSRVDSRGRRNTAYVSCSEELVQSLGRCSPAQGLSRPAVEGDRHGGQVLGAVHAEVGALWKVLPQQPVGVLVRAALPRTVGIAEVDRHASLDPELGVLGHFRSLIPGQRSSQLFG